MIANVNNKVYMVNDDQFVEIIKRNNTLKYVLLELGYSNGRGNKKARDHVKNRMKDLGIGLDRNKYYDSLCIPEDELYIKGQFRNNSLIRRRVLRDGLFEYKCSICNLGDQWMNKTLTLQLDHIDGDSSNNEKENLRWLCPNCHTQTETYANSGNRDFKSDRPYRIKDESVCKHCNETYFKKSKSQKFCSVQCSTLYNRKELPIRKEELYELLVFTPFTQVGEMYGVSNTAIRKWCNRYGIPNKSSHYRTVRKRRDAELLKIRTSQTRIFI